MSKEQKRLMEDPGKLVNESRSPLTSLWRLLLVERNVESAEWNRRLTRLLWSHLTNCPKNAKDVGQERNNFNRAIAKEQVTFRTFQKGVQTLGPAKYSMSITLQYPDGTITKVDTPWFKNPWVAMDKLGPALTGEGLTPEYDLPGFDDSDGFESALTDNHVGQKIDEIPDEDTDLRPKASRSELRKRKQR